jgi:glycosyltransferase involved in cell wall biosynthesis
LESVENKGTKKILVIPSWFSTESSPGRGIFFYEQSKALVKYGYDVKVLYPDLRSARELVFSKRGLKDLQHDIEHLENILEADIPLEIYRKKFQLYWPGRFKFNGRIFVRLGLHILKKILEDWGEPDVIISHSMKWGGYLACRINHLLKIPYLVIEHSTLYLKKIGSREIRLFNPVLHNAKKCFAVSEELSRNMKKYFSVKYDILPNYIDIDFFNVIERTDRGKNTFIFFTLGNLIERKRIDIAIKAFCRAFDDDRTVYLYIGGKGPEKKKLRALIGDNSNIRMMGFLTRERVRELMNCCDVFVLPSEMETFGVVYIEAVACGKPVIATRCGGPEDFIHDFNGILVDRDSIDDLADAMIYTRRNYDFYDRVRIRNYIVHNYSEQAVIEKLSRYI